MHAWPFKSSAKIRTDTRTLSILTLARTHIDKMTRQWNLVAVLLLIQCCGVQGELLSNPDFESTNYNNNWVFSGCHGSPSNDAHSGQHSVKLTGRTNRWNGPQQKVAVQSGHYYKATVYVKLLNTLNNAPYQEVELMVHCLDQSGQNKYNTMGKTPHVVAGEWTQVGGVAKIANGFHDCNIYVQTDAPTDFLVDTATMDLVLHDPAWKDKANTWINQHRTADLEFRLSGTVSASTNLELEVIQIKREFIFGSAVSATAIVDPAQMAYQQAFYDNFEFAVLENALKWRLMEWSRGNINYDRPLHAINALRSHGVKVRGHCTFWGVPDNVQDWVKALSASDLTAAIHQRVQGVIGHTKGLLEMWDVNNENLHGDFYERHTGNPDITMDMFRQVHAVDSHPTLFLNDYQVISDSYMTVALKEQALRFKRHNVPIGGVGAQGHMHNYDIEAIKARLDILAEAGLPILITELGVNDATDAVRAQHVSDLLTLFFSHPAVEGVLFWGFWDGQIWEKNAALFTGPNATPNAAGQAYQDLVKRQWNTYKVLSIHGNQPVHLRGFKGEYKLNVKHNGHTIHTETFSLSDGGKTVNIHLGPESGGHPTVANVVVG